MDRIQGQSSRTRSLSSVTTTRVTTPLRPVTMFVYWEQQSHQISVLIDTSPTSALPASNWLCELRHNRRSLDMDSATTLVHAFVSSRVDYCNILLASALKVVTDRLQWVLNAAARMVSSTHKYDRGLSWLLHSELHWLDVPERVQYQLSVVMYSCLHGQAPRYLTDLHSSVRRLSMAAYLICYSASLCGSKMPA